ncbi:CdaR family transcriptional regulator [Clostridium fallax]|uniref:Transcriptional regulator, CdaR family n=1 Tax=Clostridium fallax TaxID=1533 RepID=A0A1M4SFY0_9CLOT|nr:sugar diacid recognition domain-containing protein [Clostridium fallax]SHE31101.1 transcriptional regulator, CdaR family [Clostridium fallax]SQB07812.1 transcriptional regulator, CdaR family [Clostridium fallax]
MLVLNEDIAQQIVEKVMDIIPYNINIMDYKGIIIGSGDKNRLYTVHEGAKEALATKRMNEITENKDKVKLGVNSPIFFKGEVVGVIGITGNPDEVRPFGELVRVTAELLINQNYILSERKAFEIHRERLLYELVSVENDYKKELKDRCEQLGINLEVKRIAVLINFISSGVKEIKTIKNTIKQYLDEQEFIIERRHNSFVVLLKSKDKIKSILDILENKSVKVGISNKEKIIGKAVKQAKLAIKVGSDYIKKENIFYYENLYFLSVLATCKENDLMKNHVKKLKDEGEKIELIKTIDMYIECNGEINLTAKKLNIHRNTLNYRLEKINCLTGKNPKVFLDLFELYTACLLYRK